MKKYDIFVEVFNPCRGMVSILLCSVYADDLKEARQLAKKEVEPGEAFSLKYRS